ncbi:unnamed protein product [Moneuplotes crassus]|uniref:Uncharacterized protein n=1 Tax=Euplotes crassus TaxID=5936 RepID=A0AAD1XPR1_EUPCR|nr:unnamed protein product [Moneuplotes crassus]
MENQFHNFTQALLKDQQGYIFSDSSWIYPDNVFASAWLENKNDQLIAPNSKYFDLPENAAYWCGIKTHNEETNFTHKELENIPASLCTKSREATSEFHLTSSVPHSLKRGDIKCRDSLRFLRKFFLNLYKTHNKPIIRKRYVNCSSQEITESVTSTLATMIPTSLVTKDLVNYTKGILNLRNPRKLKCRLQIKHEVLDFLQTVRSFSMPKFRKSMESVSLQTLVRCLADHSEDPRAKNLHHYFSVDKN